MKGKDFKRLANVADISKLDIAASSVTLAPTEDGRILSFYEGAYAAGGAVIEAVGIDRPISLSATEFVAMSQLFDDEQDIRVQMMESFLQMTWRGKKSKLRYHGLPNIDGWDALLKFEPSARIKVEDLNREVGFASQAVSTSMANPVLSGIRLIMANKAAGVQAANGVSLIFETTIQCEATEKIEVVTPTVNLQTALRVLGGTVVSIGVKRDDRGTVRSILLSNETATVRVAAMAAAWPDMRAIKKFDYSEVFNLSVVSINAMNVATKVYTSSNDVTMRPNSAGTSVILETEETESGQYSEALPGTLSKKMVLDIGDLSLAAKMSKDFVTLEFSPQMARTRNGSRSLYMSLRG